MNYNPLTWPMLIAAIVLMGLALYARRFPDAPAARPFSLLMGLGAIYALLSALAISAVNFELHVTFFLLRYVPLVLIPPVMLQLALEYTGHADWLTRRRLLLLFLVPVIGIILALTGNYHSLFRYNFQLDLTGPLPIFTASRGPLFWVYYVYQIALIAGTFTILLTAFKVGTRYFWNAFLVVVGMLLPVLTDTLFIFGVTPIPGYNLAPAMFIFTGALYLWATLRQQIFTVAPVAWSVVLDNIEDAVIVLDTYGHIVGFNRAAQTLCGLSPRSIGATAAALPPELANQSRSADKSVLTLAGRSYNLTRLPLQNQRRRNLGQILLLHNITERQQAEAALRQSEERFKLIADVAPVPLVMTRLRDNTYQYVNALAAKMVGLPLAEAVGQKAVDFWVDLNHRQAIVKQIIRQGAVYNVEAQLKRANGQPFWALFSAALTRLNDEPFLLAGITDISERKKIENALSESEKHYRLLAENMHDVVWILDTETLYFKYVSPSVEQLRGYTPAEIMAVPVDYALTPQAREALINSIRQTRNAILAGRETSEQFHSITEVEQPRKDGSTVWTEVVTRYYLNPDTGRVELHGVTRDITERKQADKALRERTRELEQRNQELQAALNAINTLSGLVPICAWCGSKIQDDNGQWVRVETYIQAHSTAEFTHGICPDCSQKFALEAGSLAPNSKTSNH